MVIFLPGVSQTDLSIDTELEDVIRENAYNYKFQIDLNAWTNEREREKVELV